MSWVNAQKVERYLKSVPRCWNRLLEALRVTNTCHCSLHCMVLDVNKVPVLGHGSPQHHVLGIEGAQQVRNGVSGSRSRYGNYTKTSFFMENPRRDCWWFSSNQEEMRDFPKEVIHEARLYSFFFPISFSAFQGRSSWGQWLKCYQTTPVSLNCPKRQVSWEMGNTQTLQVL